MSIRRGIDLLSPDIFDHLSAIWVFSSNDENSLITYEGISLRLGSLNAAEVKDLVKNRAELFRPGVPQARLQWWKDEMTAGRHLPTWIREKPDRERAELIGSLTSGDVFRSQFRAGHQAARSSLEELDWGLQYIDRLRKASVEHEDQTAKSSQIWLVFGVGLLNIGATIAAAIIKG